MSVIYDRTTDRAHIHQPLLARQSASFPPPGFAELLRSALPALLVVGAPPCSLAVPAFRAAEHCDEQAPRLCIMNFSFSRSHT